MTDAPTPTVAPAPAPCPHLAALAAVDSTKHVQNCWYHAPEHIIKERGICKLCNELVYVNLCRNCKLKSRYDALLKLLNGIKAHVCAHESAFSRMVKDEGWMVVHASHPGLPFRVRSICDLCEADVTFYMCALCMEGGRYTELADYLRQCILCEFP